MWQRRKDEETPRLDSKMILKSEFQIIIWTNQSSELKELKQRIKGANFKKL